MKKTKLSLGLISCLLSVGALAGCDMIKSSNDGVLLTYTVDGVKGEIKADDILGDYYDDSTKYQAIYDTIYSVIARNYFSRDRGSVNYHGTTVQLGEPQMKTIERDAREKVSDDKDTAQSNADANNTKYKKEFEAILESKGVETEEELFQKYVEELQKETFENNFYTYFIEDIKTGATDVELGGKQFWTGYLKDQLPYHVSHILVELADTSDTNYYNGTISEANALRLYNVIKELGEGKKSFSKLAMTYSEDPGSKDKEGDLGIMDYDTSFINEFKLGIYAYEQFYKKTDVSAYEHFTLTDDIKNNYKKVVKDAFDIDENGIPTVDFKIFEELKNYAKDDKDENGKPVIEGASLMFPRNIIYNKYLNRHAVFFIESETEEGNFVKLDGFGGKNILCVRKAEGVYEPIVAVRGSSGDKNEIHLMVVNRSPFEATDFNNVSLEDYYTTFYPAQDFYPSSEGKKLQTYVNFLTNDASDTKTRAEEFASKLKSYNSDKLGKYIFLKYKQIEKITFAEENSKLEEALMKWIETSINKKDEERSENWTKTWNEYIDKLVRQNSERKKLVPQACKLVYKKANAEKNIAAILAEDSSFLTAAQVTAIKADIKASGCADADKSGETTDGEVDAYYAKSVTDWFKKEGGLCNDGKTHL